ncbi:integrin alpha N-terminal domain-containing protein [Artomyces pyxidatus]|uniref:Integrin alpha N-terminal domain-containing protein n=1 Tax=Artomyces pyxidatus TaxID=48021 RepID=A0ACB8SSB9_9AGAM|nr:integrin alpha N-terminal domain-containing protein [Artomyces pyxidatus]
METVRRRGTRTLLNVVAVYVCTLGAVVQGATTLWPFPQSRFTGNALVGAGSMGLDSDARVIAFGDFNGDQFLDVMTLATDQQTLSVYLWNHDDYSYHRSASFRHPRPVYNVVPGDFTHDGTLDVLVMAQDSSSSQLSMSLYAAQPGGGLNMDSITIPSSTLSQPIPLDIDGDMKIDLLGLQPGSPPTLKVWQNIWNASHTTGPLYSIIDPPFHGPQCRISNPHSSAIIDLNGDCLADIFLVCDDSTGQRSFQVWVNAKDDGFSLAQSGRLPQGTQSVAFADMDRDGTIDLLITTCTSVASNGLGTGCALNIAYNKQFPLCEPTSSVFIFDAANSTDASKKCRRPDELCQADPSFQFEFSGPSYVTHPIQTILPSPSSSPNSSPSLLVLDTTFSPPLPILPRLGDVNLDGFPDLLLITGTTQDRTRKVRLVLSEPCSGGGGGVVGCNAAGARRGWKEVKKGVEVLESVGDARGATFLDIDEDGTLDIMVQRSGDQGQGTVLFVQNNFYYDAFFMKAILLNGACGTGLCTPANASLPQYHPFGVSYSGASYKYTILDTSGRRSAAQVAQLPQTAYQALHPPYAFFGLGRTNNYIENLFAGSTQHTASHFLSLEMVIPNSQIVINPSADGAWRKELYLRPGQWIPWVGVSVLGAMIGLAGVVLVLHLNEKREDELERRRASHHINFDAL